MVHSDIWFLFHKCFSKVTNSWCPGVYGTPVFSNHWSGWWQGKWVVQLNFVRTSQYWVSFWRQITPKSHNNGIYGDIASLLHILWKTQLIYLLSICILGLFLLNFSFLVIGLFFLSFFILNQILILSLLVFYSTIIGFLDGYLRDDLEAQRFVTGLASLAGALIKMDAFRPKLVLDGKLLWYINLYQKYR